MAMSRPISVRAWTAALAVSMLFAAASRNACAAPVPASNDGAGVFENGVFSLPPLNDPNDQYFLKITVAGEKEARSVALPAGAVGLVLGNNAIPRGAWSWTFRLQQRAIAQVPLVTADKLHVSAWDLRYFDGMWLLEWGKVASANKYRVTVATDASDFSNPPKWGKTSDIECNAACVSEMTGTTVFLPIPLKPGERYRWNITALDRDGIAIAQSEARVLDVEPSPVVAFEKAGWSLQRSDTISTQNAGKPALFSYAANEDATGSRANAYTAQAALLWHGDGFAGGAAFPSLSLETRRTSSGAAKASDVTRARAGAFGAMDYATWSAALKYETVRSDSSDKGMVELGITPVFWVLDQWLSVGPAPSRDSAGNILPSSVPFLQVKPIISFSADVGKTFSAGISREQENSVRRLRSDFRLDMLWARTARVLGVVYVESYVERTYWRLSGQNKSFRLDQAGLSVGLTPQISLEASYLAGEDVPAFSFARSANIGFGIKF
jgi:hypothetical protein